MERVEEGWRGSRRGGEGGGGVEREEEGWRGRRCEQCYGVFPF